LYFLFMAFISTHNQAGEKYFIHFSSCLL